YKCGHLNTLDKASQNLKLFKADLLDYNSLCSAFEGCIGVFHVASPVPSTTLENPEASICLILTNTFINMLQMNYWAAAKGTQNVLEACTEAKARRVAVVPSVAAVLMNPSWPQGQVMDESCWSNKEYYRETKASMLQLCLKFVGFGILLLFKSVRYKYALLPCNWYRLSKTLAEIEALVWSMGKEEIGIDVVTLCPALVSGPILQSTERGRVQKSCKN
ncbi:hypothetical protein Tsubulata_047517, partial [Turnera subulata]